MRRQTAPEMPTPAPIKPDIHTFTSPEALSALHSPEALHSLEMAEFGATITGEASEPLFVTSETFGALEAVPGTPEPEKAAFVPDTPEKADWVLERIANHRARAARIRENGEAMAKQAEAEAQVLEWKYGPTLQDLARREIEGTRRRSLTLYHGVIGFKTKPAAVQISSDQAAVLWAKAHLPEAVVERVDKAAVGKALMASGEVVDFATFTPAEDVFYIK